MKSAAAVIVVLSLAACTRGTPPPAVEVPPAASSATAAVVTAKPTPPASPPPSWPKTVDTSLNAPDGFQLLASSKDGTKVLVEVTTTISFFEKHTQQQSRGNSSYVAQLDLATGCMESTFDFPTLSKASSTGTVPEALAILNSKEMATDIARAKAITSAYGPNDAPIRVSPDGHHVVLEANNEIYWAIDDKKFAHVSNRAAMNPNLSEDGRHLLFANGGGNYLPTVLDLQTGEMTPVTRSKGAPMTAKDLFPLPDGSFLVSEEPNDAATRGVAALTKICLSKIDVTHAKETEMVCIPSKVNSASVSEISENGRFVMLHAEFPDRVVVWDTSSWQIVTDAPGGPIYPKLDEQGHVAWEDNDGVILIAKDRQIGRMQMKAEASGLYPTLAGFLGNRFLIGHPTMKRFEFEAPLKTLKDANPCGWLSVIDQPQ